MEYIELWSAKYVKPALEEERQAMRRRRKERAISTCTTFLTGLAVFFGTLLVVRYMQAWRPHVEDAITRWGF